MTPVRRSGSRQCGEEGLRARDDRLGDLVLGALRFRLKDRTSIVADGAPPFGKGWQVRAGVAVRVFD